MGKRSRFSRHHFDTMPVGMSSGGSLRYSAISSRGLLLAGLDLLNRFSRLANIAVLPLVSEGSTGTACFGASVLAALLAFSSPVSAAAGRLLDERLASTLRPNGRLCNRLWRFHRLSFLSVIGSRSKRFFERNG